MDSVSNIVFHIIIFLAVYAQVFFLLTFIENRKKIITRTKDIKLHKYPGVTIIVPCFNEETTIFHTIRSLLALNYPKNKLNLLLVDDGSTDGTWNILSKFAKYSNVKVFQKENGGKYNALNLGLENSETEFVGCLDADSLVDKETLVRIMSYFEKDASIMAVAPAVVVNNPKGIVQNAQKVEYNLGVYFKKMLAFMGGIHVTPGPFTIFRKKVFDDLGPYRHAHNTEDMEIAYRMQKNYYKIEHCNDAYVYTNTPLTIPKLFKQRLRWIYGFINNTLDNKDLILNKKYGNFSLFTLPAGMITIFAVSYVFGRSLYSIGHFIFSKIIEFQTVGFNVTAWSFDFDLFFVNTQTSLFVTICVFSIVIFSILMGRNMAGSKKGKSNFISETAFYFLVFTFIAPFWVVKAVYNTIMSKTPAWR